MEFNEEIFETEEDYKFQITNCVAFRIISANQPCSYIEIMFLAKYFLPDEWFGFVKSDLKSSLIIAKGLKELDYKFDTFTITERGIDEYNSIMEDISEEHRKIIEQINTVHYDVEPRDESF